MESVFNFVKILLFGAWVELTPNPVHLSEAALEIETIEPLEVLTTGAHLRVDASQIFSGDELIRTREEVAAQFPKGCINADIYTGDNKSFHFQSSDISWSEGSTHILLFSRNALSTDFRFNKVKITSCSPAENVKLIWANYYK